jgi:hypothetical protein
MVQNRTFSIKRAVAMKMKKNITALALCVMLCWAIIGSAAAETSSFTNSETSRENASVAIQTAATQSATPAVQPEEGNAAVEYLHEEQFSTDHSVAGVSSQFVEYFHAGDWDISLAKFTLHYTATQLEDTDVSSITLSINGTPFYSERVVPSFDYKAYELTLALPISAIKDGQNSITVESYMRTEDGTCCTDNKSGAAWMTISKESTISLQYLPLGTCNTVADFCKNFVSVDALENMQSAAYVRSNADDTELTTAAIILAGISGQAAMHYDNIALKTADEKEALLSSKYSIYVSKYASLPSVIADGLSTEEKQAAQSDAVLALLKLGENCNVLLITGTRDDALINAARLIGNASYIAQAKHTWRSVTNDENVLMPKKEISQYMKLTESGTQLAGASNPSASYYIELPDNRKLSYSSQLSLSMRYSDNLDFNRSLVTVYINDTAIGSKKLEEKKAQGDTELFDIPTDLQINGNFTIKVMFNLETVSNSCICENGKTQWAWISSESILKLTAENVDSILFEYYPSPFIKDGNLNNVVAVLPDSPGEASLNALRQIMLTLGRNLDGNAGALRVVHASNVSDLSDSNIISIGKYKDNTLAQQNNDKAFFRFCSDGTTLCSNEKMLIDPNYGASLGTVQLLDSPYSNEKRALMLVTGVSDEAMLRGVKYIGFSDNLWKIYGDGYVTDGIDVFPFRFKADNAKTHDIAKDMLSRTDIGNVAISAGLVIILTLVSLILLLRKHRKTRKGNKE